MKVKLQDKDNLQNLLGKLNIGQQVDLPTLKESIRLQELHLITNNDEKNYSKLSYDKIRLTKILSNNNNNNNGLEV